MFNFKHKLEKIGYKVIRKPLDKANVDVELAIDAILERESYNTLILASGDSDYSYLVEILKKIGKYIIVLSARGHISKELARGANEFISLESLKEEISRQKIIPPEGGRSYRK